MRRLLSSAVAAGALALGGLTALPAAPASASLPPYCVLVLPGAGTTSCDFNGVGPEGTYSVTVASGTATLTIDCDTTGPFTDATTLAVVAHYPRGALMNTCTATLTSTLDVATATLT